MIYLFVYLFIFHDSFLNPQLSGLALKTSVTGQASVLKPICTPKNTLNSLLMALFFYFGIHISL